MNLRSSKGLFGLAAFLVAAANAFVLGGAAYNRSGSPEAVVVLSERELEPPYRRRPAENSGLSLRLTWRVLGKQDDARRWPSSPVWFTADKLETLGFALEKVHDARTTRRYVRDALPKAVYIVLENDGAAYREALDRATARFDRAQAVFQSRPASDALRKALEEARKALARERTSASRLFAVDAGREAARLREIYPDRTRFIIAEGLVRPVYRTDKNETWIEGTIMRMVVESIHVPRFHRAALEEALIEPRAPVSEGFTRPRYLAEVAYGRRFEPWIVSVKETGTGTLIE